MRSNEELTSQLQDTLFELMMNQAAEAQGEAALEEAQALNRDPDVAVPPETEAQCVQTIERTLRKKQLQAMGKTILKCCRWAAIWILVVIGVFTVTLVSSDAFRETVFNFVYREFDYKIEFGISREEEYTNDFAEDPSAVTAGWVPEGFSLMDKDHNKHRSWEVYTDKQNDLRRIELSISFYENPQIDIDTEGAVVSHAQIDGYKAVVVEKPYSIVIAWVDTYSNILCTVTGDRVDRDDAIKFAENIIFG